MKYWLDNSDFTRSEIKKWKKANFSLEEAKKWTENGFSVEMATYFSDFNLEPTEVRQYLIEELKKKHEENLIIRLENGTFQLEDIEKLFKKKQFDVFL